MAVALLRSLSAVEAVDAIERIPEEYKPQSFFGEYDLWLYVPVYTEEWPCQECEKHNRKQVFRGTELRSTFEYLKILDDDRIKANVHPNCRCELYRIIGVEQYLRWLEKLERRENKS